MKKLVYFAACCMAAFVMVSLFSCNEKAQRVNLKTDVDSLSYAYGVMYSQGLDGYLQNQGYEGAALDEFFKGFSEGSKVNTKDKKVAARFEGKIIGKQLMDMFNGINGNLFGPDSTASESLDKSLFFSGFISSTQNKHLYIPQESAQMYVQMKSMEVQNKANEPLKVENLAFLENNKTKPGVIALPSGLQYKVEKEGKGRKPTSADQVKVNYRGTDMNGVEFEKNDEAVFLLGGVIQGWTEGIQLMSIGSKYTFYIPYDLGYGEMGNPPTIKPYATLIFEVELLDIVK